MPKSVDHVKAAMGYMYKLSSHGKVWMKSLIMSGNGCTVFDSHGEIIYRMDNYDCRRNDRVYLMDARGEVLLTVVRKKFSFTGHWEGYRSIGSKLEKGKPWFRVRKTCNILRDFPCQVTVSCHENETDSFKILASARRNSACKIVDREGRLVAEVYLKKAPSGELLGDDVLTLVVEPFVDHSLVMGLVTVYNMIKRKI
ncbi:PREDICTED: protein LURP-one-related 2-like [Nelumbo nucifera]|uniref:Protein LURP-one-related 2-like n=1 Tax=Nelumbo nucifera TaxID=4432 RepID=A0A1U7Z9Y5_NELNU|nr:PREDICTED: protein LURP-one-related 2-like [Nelumbo nucifera]